MNIKAKSILPAIHPWNVKTAFFEGPLDVLLALIRNKKKQITDISLAEICQPFLDYLKFKNSLDLDADSEFINIAASLILIKSRSLLPEEKEVEDNADAPELNLEEDLKARLLAYDKVRKLSLLLDARDRLYRDFFCRTQDMPLIENYSNKVQLVANIYNFSRAYQQVLTREMTIKPYILEEAIWDVSAKIKQIAAKLEHNNSINFLELCQPLSKTEVLTSLMAVLEMAKLGQLKTIQASLFSDFFCIKA